MITIEFYEKKGLIRGKQWYWRAIAANGKIIADGAEGYSEERWARHGFNVLKNGLMSDQGYHTKVTPLA